MADISLAVLSRLPHAVDQARIYSIDAARISSGAVFAVPPAPDDALPPQFVALSDEHAFGELYKHLVRAMRADASVARYWMAVEDAMCGPDMSERRTMKPTASVTIQSVGTRIVPVGTHAATFGILIDTHTGSAAYARSAGVTIAPAILAAYVAGSDDPDPRRRPWTLGEAAVRAEAALAEDGTPPPYVSAHDWYAGKLTSKPKHAVTLGLLIQRLHANITEIIKTTEALERKVVAACVTYSGHKGVAFTDVMPALQTEHETLATIAHARALAHLMLEGGLKVLNVRGIVALQSRGYLCLPILTTFKAVDLGVYAPSVLVCPAFKAGALPDDAVDTVLYTKEYSEVDGDGKPIPEALCMHKDSGALRGQNVMIVDDVVATGGSLGAAIDLAQKQGARVLGAFVVAAVKPLLARAIKQTYARGVPLFVLT